MNRITATTPPSHFHRFVIVVSVFVAALVLASPRAHASEPAELRPAPGIVISAEPGSVFRTLATRSLTLRGGKKVRANVIALQRGRISVAVHGEGAVMVHASNRINAICDSGQMTVVRSEGESVVANVEGTTFLAGRKGLEAIESGHARRWAAGHVMNHALPAAPSFAPERTVWVDLGRGADLSGLSWPDSAASYELVASRSGVRVWSIRTEEASLKAGDARLGEGAYELKLRGIDEHGLAGRWSAAARIQVIGINLPDGAYVDDAGVVRLGRGQEVSFRGTEDIVITAGGDGRYRTVRVGVGLEADREESVWFRPKQAPRPQASIQIGPRQFKADVGIRVDGRSWSESPLLISVQVKGANGGPAPTWLRPRARVMLGIDPIDVKWKRAGSRMVAVVSKAPKAPGPWVVRVQVDDQYGTPIGRAFRELDDPGRR